MIAPDIKSLRMAGWLFVLLAMNYPGKSQHVDSKEIEALINEWNFANNTRSVDGFANVYHTKLLFYTQTVSRSAAIAFKQKLFQRQPGFEQRIVTPITYTPYTSGVVKCDFTKEVFEDSTRRLYPGYLLVSYENNRYWIVGESDYKTDKTLNYKLDLGQPIEFGKQEDREQQQLDSFTAADLSNKTENFENVKPASDSSKIINKDASQVQDNKPVQNNKRSLSSALITSDTTAIPKRYLFILIGLMVIGGIMIFIADSIGSKKLSDQKSLAKTRTKRDRVGEFKDQAAFEQFVISLFDPLYFRYRRAKPGVVLAGKGLEREPMADFEFDFRNKEKHARFAVRCIYHREVQPEMLFSSEKGKRIEFLEEDQNLYFILGAGARPDDPKELFLLPAKVVSSQTISLKELQPYRKHGMFYYNSSTQTLQ
jgi:hypothetical protein